MNVISGFGIVLMMNTKNQVIGGINIKTVKNRVNQLSLISTKELSEKLDDHNVKIIDIRPIEAYNGWKLQNEKRGGHIKGAKSLPYKWSQYLDWIEIVRSKDITPENRIIIYGYEPSKIEQIAHQFKKAGMDSVNPTKEQLLTALQNLVLVSQDLRGPEVAKREYDKFVHIINQF